MLNLIRRFVFLLFVVLGSASSLSMFLATKPTLFFEAPPKNLTQHAEVNFSARAPPLVIQSERETATHVAFHVFEIDCENNVENFAALSSGAGDPDLFSGLSVMVTGAQYASTGGSDLFSGAGNAGELSTFLHYTTAPNKRSTKDEAFNGQVDPWEGSAADAAAAYFGFQVEIGRLSQAIQTADGLTLPEHLDASAAQLYLEDISSAGSMLGAAATTRYLNQDSEGLSRYVENLTPEERAFWVEGSTQWAKAFAEGIANGDLNASTFNQVAKTFRNNRLPGAVGGDSKAKNGGYLGPTVDPVPPKQADFPPGSTAGSAKAWTKTARIKDAQLPNSGRIRFVPDPKWDGSTPIKRGPNNGYLDRFGNEWTKGPSRTQSQAFEWDVQLSNTGRQQIGWTTRDGSHANVSLDGRITHK